MVKGIEGYAEAIQKFIEATLSISFKDLHRDFMDYMPAKPAYVLDVGAGIGRDAFEFASLGHQVVAVEPCQTLLHNAQKMYTSPHIQWVNDALPLLETLENQQFDFVLASGIWHHLKPEEQKVAMERISKLLKTGGVLAISLRNGPAGLGSHIFPTDALQSIKLAKAEGLSQLLYLKNQASLLPGKDDVKWERLVFMKNSK